MNDEKRKVNDTKREVNLAKCKVNGAKCKVNDAKCEGKDTKCKVNDTIRAVNNAKREGNDRTLAVNGARCDANDGDRHQRGAPREVFGKMCETHERKRERCNATADRRASRDAPRGSARKRKENGVKMKECALEMYMSTDGVEDGVGFLAKFARKLHADAERPMVACAGMPYCLLTQRQQR